MDLQDHHLPAISSRLGAIFSRLSPINGETMACPWQLFWVYNGRCNKTACKSLSFLARPRFVPCDLEPKACCSLLPRCHVRACSSYPIIIVEIFKQGPGCEKTTRRDQVTADPGCSSSELKNLRQQQLLEEDLTGQHICKMLVLFLCHLQGTTWLLPKRQNDEN